jgi:hypothetical protein
MVRAARAVLYTEVAREAIAIWSLDGINQHARCGMSAYVSTRAVTLQSVEEEPLDVTLHETDGSVECNIFHSACKQLEIEGELAAWHTAERSYDCIELRCQHRFNACALALHFLTNYMTCPLCRDGVHAKMSLTCVPENIKNVYLRHISPSVVADVLEFAPAVFLGDLRLQVDFMPRCADSRRGLTLTSPCIPVSCGAEAGDVFRTQHSFRRQFSRHLKAAGPQACRFSLVHPLISTALCSHDLSCDALCGYTFTLPHDIAVVCCCVEHEILTIDLQLNLAVLYSMCVTTVMQYMDDN